MGDNFSFFIGSLFYSRVFYFSYMEKGSTCYLISCIGQESMLFYFL